MYVFGILFGVDMLFGVSVRWLFVLVSFVCCCLLIILNESFFLKLVKSSVQRLACFEKKFFTLLVFFFLLEFRNIKKRMISIDHYYKK
jgi:hypothetical protein